MKLRQFDGQFRHMTFSRVVEQGKVSIDEEKNLLLHVTQFDANLDQWFNINYAGVQKEAPNLFSRFKLLNTGHDLCEAGSAPSANIRPSPTGHVTNTNQPTWSNCWTAQSAYQSVHVVDTGVSGFGKVLYLNCETQSSEADEGGYHESLVHPALLSHPNPRTVFIGGGGEGATPREVLKHPMVERVVMYDLDEKLVTLSMKTLPYWSGVKNDSRLELHFGDAVAALQASRESSFDVIVWDMPDAGKDTSFLSEKAVFKLIRSRLKQDGVFTSHASGGGSDLCVEENSNCFFVPKLYHMLLETFTSVSLLLTPLPLWRSHHPFVVALVSAAHSSVHKWQAGEVNHILAVRGLSEQLIYYNGAIHERMVRIPSHYLKFVRSFREVHLSVLELSMEHFFSSSNIYKSTHLTNCSCRPSECVDAWGYKGPFDPGYLN